MDNNSNLYKITSYIGNFFKNGFNSISRDKLFKYTFIAIFLKTIIFLLLISDDNAVSVNFKSVLYSMPPILVYFCFIALILSFSYLFKNKWHCWSFLFLDMLVTLIYIGDIWYYRGNRSFLNYHMFGYTSNLDNLGDSIFAMFRPIDLIFIVDIILLFILIIKNKKDYRNFKISMKNFLLLFLIPIVYLTYCHYKVDKFRRSYENQYIFYKTWAQNQTMTNLTPIGYHLFDIYDFYKENKPYTLTSDEKNEAINWFKNKNEDLPDNEYKDMFKGKNLVILQVESLENFVIGNTINGQEITPNLNKILNNSFYFNNFHEQTFNGTTSDAELITNTSVFPVRSGGTFFRFPTNSYTNSLPNIMREMGYSTLASHPDKGSYWNWLQSLKSIGYDKCLDSASFEQDDIIGLGLSDESFLKQLADTIETQPKPFLSYSITLTSHTPFGLPEDLKTLDLEPELKDHILGKYFDSIRYTDKQIGNFLDTLDSKGLLDNTVVVIYGDHEGPNKFFGDEIKNIKNGEPWFQNNDRKVPLIMFSKGMEGKTFNTIGGQCDTLPTISYLFGADKPESNYYFGRNLLNTNKDFTVLSDRSIRSNNMSEEEKSAMLKSIDLSDKLIRANFFDGGK